MLSFLYFGFLIKFSTVNVEIPSFIHIGILGGIQIFTSWSHKVIKN